MAGNSQDRKKALIVSMLLFLMTGGGIFLFFVVQGSNDLIGKGKEFSYGGAAREGVSSFFKYVGASSEEGIVSESGKIRAEAKGIVLGEPLEAPADVSDWMEKPAAKSAASAGPASVPRMAGGGLSGAGGIGGGGSRSSGGVTRYGEGSGLGNTKIGGGAGADGAADKGTLASLRNAKAALGEGLRSGSAMTARSKWGSGFGEGSGKGGNLAYGTGGLVKLDTIKKGEVASLKTSYMKKPEVPEAGAFERDKDAEKKDAGIQAAKEAAKEAAEAAAKKAAIQAALQAAASGVGGTSSNPTPKSGTGGPGQTATTPDGADVPPGVLNTLKSGFCSNDCSNSGGTVADTNATVTPGANGNYNVTYLGSVTKDGVTTPNVEVWELDKNGAVIKQIR